MVIGAWFAGIFGDRYGRRYCYRVNLLLFAIPSLAAVWAPSMDWLIVARFFMGIGMGAEIVIGFATLSEFVPPLQRGRWGAALSTIMNSAVFVSALTGYLIIPTIGWRWMFGVVGICALIVWVFRQALPEFSSLAGNQKADWKKPTRFCWLSKRRPRAMAPSRNRQYLYRLR